MTTHLAWRPTLAEHPRLPAKGRSHAPDSRAPLAGELRTRRRCRLPAVGLVHRATMVRLRGADVDAAGHRRPRADHH
jgi:hypothetical protein